MQLKPMLTNLINQEIKTGYAFGVITALTSTPVTCSIELSGSDEVITGIRVINSYSPSVDDTVLVLIMEKDLLILGNLTP